MMMGIDIMIFDIWRDIKTRKKLGFMWVVIRINDGFIA